MPEYSILLDNDRELQKAFLSLPSRLYTRKTNPQDRKCEQEILREKHVLSGDFSVLPFVVLKSGRPVSRALLTVYPGDREGYFGFFESENDKEAVKLLMEAVKKKAKSLGLSSLAGPVNASFWIGYRLKTDHFGEEPYTGEPYNPDYYPALFTACGFTASDRYYSNHFRQIPEDYHNKRMEKRREQFAERGIVLQNLDPEKYDETMHEVYFLLTALYSDFPAFKMISEEKFMKLFASYRLIVNPDMVKFAYDQGKMVGFFICVPDYGNALYGPLSPRLIRTLLWRRKHAKRYVLPYLGADPAYLGLGPVLTDAVIRELQKNRALSIGALIHEHKVTGNYARDLLIGMDEYTLYRLELR